MHPKELTITNASGIHARPAAAIARIAQTAKSGVWICHEEERVDATSIIDILTLACGQGARITLHAEDPEDLPILDSIAMLIENGFGE
ncbi:phosphocarrier protein [Desulfobotulus alkaliphilus]|uniref:Phosphocarrier protein n=1 Tax=Desulfobotulus alkaliphilus TaxID=622671 RepID=A0A562R9P6_9BACT|nr:HPr family phosphocarrier protein [Desulfobotulus alkaliphilus]TWI65745.1 phosphocarrier protein [Desulfobotulus alkaliphilus]